MNASTLSRRPRRSTRSARPRDASSAPADGSDTRRRLQFAVAGSFLGMALIAFAAPQLLSMMGGGRSAIDAVLGELGTSLTPELRSIGEAPLPSATASASDEPSPSPEPTPAPAERGSSPAGPALGTDEPATAGGLPTGSTGTASIAVDGPILGTPPAATVPPGPTAAPTPIATAPIVPLPSQPPAPTPPPTPPPTPQPTPDPTPEPTPEPTPVLPECSDGVDNDGDILADWPLDLGCTSPTDDDESGPIL
jgi:hypothetical protein